VIEGKNMPTSDYEEGEYEWVEYEEFTLMPYREEYDARKTLGVGLGPIFTVILAALLFVGSLIAVFLGSGSCPELDVPCQMARAASLSLGLMGIFFAFLIAVGGAIWAVAARRRRK